MDAENSMLDYIKFRCSHRDSLSLVGEPKLRSVLRRELRNSGYTIKDVYTKLHPLTESSAPLGDIVIGTRPCNLETHGVNELFLTVCTRLHKKFILLPCTCGDAGRMYQQKLVHYVRDFPCITKIEAKDNYIFLTNITY